MIEAGFADCREFESMRFEYGVCDAGSFVPQRKHSTRIERCVRTDSPEQVEEVIWSRNNWSGSVVHKFYSRRLFYYHAQ